MLTRTPTFCCVVRDKWALARTCQGRTPPTSRLHGSGRVRVPTRPDVRWGHHHGRAENHVPTRWRIKSLASGGGVGSYGLVQGWVRSCRQHKSVTFLDISDGSCPEVLQVVLRPDAANGHLDGLLGAAVQVKGLFASNSKGAARGSSLPVEMTEARLQVIGACDPESYPLQNRTPHPPETLRREFAHLRPRTRSFGAMMRLRSRIAVAIHQMMAERGFVWVHAPAITTNDCEGAGELFGVVPKDFFGGDPAYLSVSAQLHAEAFALALGQVYTFGPTFRAEPSRTSRHLAEFIMIEPEIAFADLDQAINLAVDLLACGMRVVSDSPEASEEWRAIQSGSAVPTDAADQPEAFSMPARITYREAIERLNRGGDLPTLAFGDDLSRAHELELTRKLGAVVVTHYPVSIKPFYMRRNDRDPETANCFDLLVPGVGEIAGGSEREDQLDVLQSKTPTGAKLNWYLDLRRFGSAPHAGFGMGFERLIQYITKAKHIRDTVAIVRTSGGGCFM